MPAISLTAGKETSSLRAKVEYPAALISNLEQGAFEGGRVSPVEQKLRAAFVQALGLPPTMDVTQLAYGGDERWDSVAHMQLVAAIESAFDIMLDIDDVIDLSSYPKAIEILGKYGVAC
jgi:acyl carrier protein